jgi:hypothetical protein
MQGTMTVARSLVLILSVSCFVLFAYLVGFGLATHSTTGMIIGVGFLVASGLLMWLQTRLWRREPAHPHH